MMKPTKYLTAITSLLLFCGVQAQAQTLTDLALSAGTLDPAFNSGTMNYTATVPYGTTSVSVTATAAPGTPITLNGATIASGMPSPAQALNIGTNLFKVGVFGNTAVFYDVVVTREEAPAPILTGLSLSQGTLSPTFDSATKSYTAMVPYSVQSISLTATAPEGMLISISGKVLESGVPSSPFDLTVGSNAGSIAVFSGDDVTVYSVVVTREAPSAPELTGLALSAGTLSPDFDTATSEYTATVPYSVSSISVTATASPGTTLTLNGNPISSGQPSPPQNLTVGDNTLVVALYTDSAAAYTVVVTREAGETPVLSGLTLSDGTLAPAFSSDTKNYTATVPYTTTSISVTATAPPGMIISLDAAPLTSGTPSAPKVLNVGDNSLQISVLSGSNGEVYTVVVTREASVSGPILTDLSLSEGTLDPVFDSNVRSYTSSVPYSVSAIAVTATAPAGTTISLSGAPINSGQPSPPQTLSVGANELVLTLFTGSSSTYTVTVSRATAPAPILTGLTLSAGTLTPAFDSDTKSYTATVPYSVSSIALTAMAPAGMVMNLGGQPLQSGQPSSDQTLNVGVNDFQISVLSGSEGTTYSVAVTREQAPPPMLTSLTLSEGTLTPAFDSAVNSYTATVPNGTTSVVVTATAEVGAVITLNGNVIPSGQPSPAHSLNVGANNLNISVFNTSSALYSVVVSRQASDQPVFTENTLQGGLLTLKWTGAGTLQATTNLSTWTSIPTVSNTHNVDITQAPHEYFRIEQ